MPPSTALIGAITAVAATAVLSWLADPAVVVIPGTWSMPLRASLPSCARQ